MKRFIVILCALFMGPVVSAVSAELSSFTFKCSVVTPDLTLLESFFDLKDTNKKTNFLIKKIIGADPSTETICGEIVHAPLSNEALLKIIKQNFDHINSLSACLGLRYTVVTPRGPINIAVLEPLDELPMECASYPLTTITIIVGCNGPFLQYALRTLLNSDSLKIYESKEHLCSNKDCQKKGALKCSQCHEAYYCSTQCQRADWRAGHKEECLAFKQAVKASRRQ